MQAMVINGKANVNDYGKELMVKSLIFADNTTFWQVVVTYAEADNNITNAINEIMDSIALIEK
jgi:hypothetical protein